jgi:hypothetical protein
MVEAVIARSGGDEAISLRFSPQLYEIASLRSQRQLELA